jgi:hypothetical protein
MMTPREQALQKRVSELCEEVRRLNDRIEMIEDALSSELQGWFCPGLTATQKRVVALLVKKRFATKSAIMAFLYSDRADDPPEEKIVDVMICKIRPKLPPGCEIRTVWGEGFELTEASIRILKGLAGGANGQAT